MQTTALCSQHGRLLGPPVIWVLVPVPLNLHCMGTAIHERMPAWSVCLGETGTLPVITPNGSRCKRYCQQVIDSLLISGCGQLGCMLLSLNALLLCATVSMSCQGHLMALPPNSHVLLSRISCAAVWKTWMAAHQQLWMCQEPVQGNQASVAHQTPCLLGLGLSLPAATLESCNCYFVNDRSSQGADDKLNIPYLWNSYEAPLHHHNLCKPGNAESNHANGVGTWTTNALERSANDG